MEKVRNGGFGWEAAAYIGEISCGGNLRVGFVWKHKTRVVSSKRCRFFIGPDIKFCRRRKQFSFSLPLPPNTKTDYSLSHFYAGAFNMGKC